MTPGLRSRLALAAIGRRLPAMVARDSQATLAQGLHVAIVGSGSPLPDRRRGCACAVVMAGGRSFVVDAGERSAETMARMGLAPSRVEAVLLTHFHSDHIGGLGTLALARWMACAARSPMRVLGPPGVERVVAGVNEAYALDSSYRTAHHGPELAPPSGSGMTAEPFAMPGGEAPTVVLEHDGLRITAFAVDHAPVVPALGYRFDYEGRAVVISGDTVYSPSLVRAAERADLLIHDSLSAELLGLVERTAREAGLQLRARMLADVPAYHAGAARAADAARDARVGALALTHVIPPLPLRALEPLFMGDAREHFAGPMWVARDGDLYSLPTGTGARTGGVERARLIGRSAGG